MNSKAKLFIYRLTDKWQHKNFDRKLVTPVDRLTYEPQSQKTTD